jgi:hypothetical protein
MSEITPTLITTQETVVEAALVTEENWRDIADWIGGKRVEKLHNGVVSCVRRVANVKPAEGTIAERPLSSELTETFNYKVGDYVVKSDDGLYLMSAQLFALLGGTEDSEPKTVTPSEPTVTTTPAPTAGE